MRRIVGSLSAALLVLFPAVASAQTAVLRGHVTDSTGMAVAHAAVTVEGRLVRTTTSDLGAYQLRGVPAGTWTVNVRAIGYHPGSARVVVTAGQEAVQDFTLASQPIVVAAIDVVVGSTPTGGSCRTSTVTALLSARRP